MTKKDVMIVKSKTISLRLDIDDLEQLEKLFANGMPSKAEQIRRIVKYYLSLSKKQQMEILQKGYSYDS